MSYAPVSAWDTNPDNNANQPGIPMYEGMSPAQLNDSIRTIMASIRQAYIDITTIAAIDASNLSAEDIADWQEVLSIPGGIGAGTIFTTGDVKMSMAVNPPTGWLLLDGRTFGNESSSGTARKNSDTLALFELLWTNCPSLPIFDSNGVGASRGSTAASDFAINRAIATPNAQGQMLRVWDGSGQIDYNRQIGSLQPDQMQGFHVLSGVGANNSAGSIYSTTTTGCPGIGTGYTAQNAGAPPQQSVGAVVSDGTNGTPRLGAETRSKNIAINVMIKI